mmetsp:Transcript_13799/g.26788  ORF Transcript_13799/g.26788 Transcript_13799/m.26788 type:complete len:378 (+) Transcript_13799:399-1532(+)
MEPQNYGQHEDGSEAWAVHRASQSPSMLTQGQMNLVLLCVFGGSFMLNYVMDAGEATSAQGEVDLLSSVLIILGCIVLIMWGLLAYKIRECVVWPEEVRFRRDGIVVVSMGCGNKALNTANGGVTLLKRRVLWNDGLGVFCNVITDKTRDDVYVLVPTTGPRYWYGFAFQPEDPATFVYDCSHAGILIEGGADAEMGVVDGHSRDAELRESLLSRNQTDSWLRSMGFSRISSQRSRGPLLGTPRRTPLHTQRTGLLIDSSSDEEEDEHAIGLDDSNTANASLITQGGGNTHFRTDAAMQGDRRRDLTSGEATNTENFRSTSESIDADHTVHSHHTNHWSVEYQRGNSGRFSSLSSDSSDDSESIDTILRKNNNIIEV